jgi:hypothetical protein
MLPVNCAPKNMIGAGILATSVVLTETYGPGTKGATVGAGTGGAIFEAVVVEGKLGLV